MTNGLRLYVLPAKRWPWARTAPLPVELLLSPCSDHPPLRALEPLAQMLPLAAR
jgi:hypothetical protein